MFAPLPFVNRKALYYSPYPRLSPPPFDAVAGVGLFGLLVPAIVVKRGAADDRD